MSVYGECPQCGYKRASFMNIDTNNNVAVDCPPGSGCNYQAATPLTTAMELIDADEFPVQLK
jgi:hypothetical protein